MSIMSCSGFLKTMGSAAIDSSKIFAGGLGLLATGLGGPITLLSRRVTGLARPFVQACIYANTKMADILPSIYYHSNQRLPACARDDCARIPRNHPNDPINYRCRLFQPTLFAPLSEELIFRGLVQRTLLPWVASKLPNPLSNLINHKIFRVVFTSLLFAAGHTMNRDSFGREGHENLAPTFAAGLVWGLSAEAHQSLRVPILSHFLINAGIMAWFSLGPPPPPQ